MLDLLSTQNQLHTRLVDFGLQEYMFVLQVILGERPEVAYANTYDVANFKRNVPSEDEEDYLASFKQQAQIQLETQNCRQLREYLESEYQIDVQEKASTLSDYKFTGAEVQRLLNNLLHERSQELSEASVRDILALIKSMYDSGALDSGDNFANHFITVPNKYNTVCPQCQREGYAVDGLDFRCEHCGCIAKWDENTKRYFPNLTHL
jgi:hypothetical protein